VAENIVLGQTAPIDHQLLFNGVAVDLTGRTVEVVLRRGSTTADTAGDVSIIDNPTGKVRFTPDATDLLVGVYMARWKVTSGAEIAFFPDGEGDPWTVRL